LITTTEAQKQET